ncbi:MAG: mercury methylation corrinoid protein HgcA [Bacteroidetes bacterium]|nr:mercury methylation corrinoid protein HgcA [Bacteroidota bacterium]
MLTSYIHGEIETPVGPLPRIATKWTHLDRWGALKTRWSVGRMKYRVRPGIYAVGNPDRDSRVFVTGNFKLSFDHLRRNLEGLNCWILVIDTKGINVWCAAGKGSFGTKEVVRRIRIHHLAQLVDQRKLILPQLSAPGVSAHEVRKMTGFTVVYGPVLARDIRAFLDAGLKASDEMRQVNFPLFERLKLIPVDIFYGKQYMLIVPLVFLALSGLNPQGYSFDLALNSGWKPVVNLFSGYLAGCALTPALLPWIPFRRFSIKGVVTGWFVAVPLLLAGTLGISLMEKVSWFLMMGGLSSFMAMNFTGSTTFTSLSGVQKEMKTALPAQIAMASLGLAGWIITRFIFI